MEDILKNVTDYLYANLGSAFALFILGFLLWGSFILFILSRFSWKKFANRYESEDQEGYEKIGIISAKVGWINYNNCLILSCSKDRFHLKTMLLFRLGHKSLAIPFADIEKVEQKKLFGVGSITLIFKDQNVPPLQLRLKTWNKLKKVSGINLPNL